MPKISEMIGKKEKSFKPDGSRWPELVGIELELENMANMRELPYWQLKADNSLRNGVEYVFDQPYGGPSIEAALDAYYGAKFQYDNSARTSTHVHINVLDTDLDAVRAMIMIVYMIEDALFNVIEGERKWAGYSMPLSEMNTERLRTMLSAPWPDYGNKLLGALAPTKNQERYYGFNFAAARKYGTVEFRYFPGGPTRQELESWLDLIVALKKAAVAVGSPAALIDRLNTDQNVVEFLDEFLPGSWSNALLKQANGTAMLDKFNEVAALCTEFVLDRRDPMMFITPSLMKFIGTKMMVKEGLTYLEKLRPLGVMTADEWDYHYSKAQRLERGQKHDDDLDTKLEKIRDYANRPVRITRDDPVEEDPFEDEAGEPAPAPAPAVGPPIAPAIRLPPGQVDWYAGNPFDTRITRTAPPPRPAPRTDTIIRRLETDIRVLQTLINECLRNGNDVLLAQYRAQRQTKVRELEALRPEPFRPI